MLLLRSARAAPVDIGWTCGARRRKWRLSCFSGIFSAARTLSLLFGNALARVPVTTRTFRTRMTTTRTIIPLHRQPARLIRNCNRKRRTGPAASATRLNLSRITSVREILRAAAADASTQNTLFVIRLTRRPLWPAAGPLYSSCDGVTIACN